MAAASEARMYSPLPTPRISGLPRLAPMMRIREIRAEDRHAERSVQPLQCLLDGPFELVLPAAPVRGIAVAVEVADQVGDHLGVRLAEKRDPLALQPGLQRAVVLDDPVVDDGDLAGAVHVRVGVDRVRHAVRGPAGVPDAQRIDAPRGLQNLFQGRDSAAGLLDADAALAQQRDAGRVVTPVFQPLEALDENRLSGLLPQIGNYAAHTHLPIDYLRFTIFGL